MFQYSPWPCYVKLVFVAGNITCKFNNCWTGNHINQVIYICFFEVEYLYTIIFQAKCIDINQDCQLWNNKTNLMNINIHRDELLTILTHSFKSHKMTIALKNNIKGNIVWESAYYTILSLMYSIIT